MTSAHTFFRMYGLKTVLSLLHFETEYPYKLTSTQKLTRTYRNILRHERDTNFKGSRVDPQDFYNNAVVGRRLVESLWDEPEGSGRWRDVYAHLDEVKTDGLDGTFAPKDMRPYSPIQGRYFVYNDEHLAYDPFGYYSHNRLLGDRKPAHGFYHYPDFPHSFHDFVIDPPIEFEDGPENEEFTRK